MNRDIGASSTPAQQAIGARLGKGASSGVCAGLDFCGGSIKTLRRAAGVPKDSDKSTKRDALIADIDAGGFKRPKKGAKHSRR